ncbi:MAG: UDP-2,3-diacylglucosamine diphosphatase [Planctomycetota bacterium]
MKVLGTRLFAARGDERERTVLVSDLHLPAVRSAVHDWFEELLARAREQAAKTRILILGDLFDVWVNDRQRTLPAWDRTIAALRETTDRSVIVDVIVGNRDYMLGAAFARAAGVVVRRGGLLATLAGVRTVLLHGDELCLRDRPYQRVKPILRSLPVRGVLAAMPRALALRLASRARKVSQDVQARGRTSPESALRYEATAEAIETAFRVTAAMRLIYGHVHRPSRTRLAEDREVLVLPAFDEAGVHLTADSEQLRFVDRYGCDHPDYPPRVPGNPRDHRSQ